MATQSYVTFKVNGINMFYQTGIKDSGLSFDTDAQAFITTANISNSTQQTAIDTLVTSLKTNGLWTKIYALYPFVGGNATAHSYNLINTANYRLSFFGGGTHTSLGYVGNGSNGYADTGLNARTVLSQNNTHVSYYSQSNIAETVFCLGASDTVASTSLLLNVKNASGFTVGYVNTGSQAQIATSTGKMFSIISRSSASSVNFTNNQTTTNVSSNSALPPNLSLFINARNLNGSFSNNSSKTSSTVTIGTALTNSEAQTLSTIINTYNTTLSRGVY